MENSRAVAILNETLALKSAGVPGDREIHILAARFREIQTGELFHLPVCAGVKVMPAVRIHDRNFHFSRLIRAVNRPVTALCLPTQGRSQPERRAANNQNQSHHSIEIHGPSPVSYK